SPTHLLNQLFCLNVKTAHCCEDLKRTDRVVLSQEFFLRKVTFSSVQPIRKNVEPGIVVL
ncbi:hypothetical protein, partial [Salmonella enterica]|uniref:hypothetical protein n=1 Tax=Salmonella enterica TaxID=28901 RepID=UPI0027E3C53B